MTVIVVTRPKTGARYFAVTEAEPGERGRRREDIRGREGSGQREGASASEPWPGLCLGVG